MKKDALQIALRYLKFRPRTEFEMREKLRSKKYEEKDIAKTLKILRDNELLDDKKFAHMWVHDRNLLRPSGVYVLKMELKKLGVAEGIIESALKNQDEDKAAEDALMNKQGFFSRFLGEEKRMRMYSFLKRRGFNYGVSKKAVEKYLKQ